MLTLGKRTRRVDDVIHNISWALIKRWKRVEGVEDGEKTIRALIQSGIAFDKSETMIKVVEKVSEEAEENAYNEFSLLLVAKGTDWEARS